MLCIRKLPIAIMLFIVTLGACATDTDRNDNNRVPQIRSTKDLKTYLQATPSSPLNYLSADARQHFVNSLVFTENGLGSFRYSELITLSTADIRQILSLLGMERTMSLFTKENAPGNFDVIQDYCMYDYRDIGSSCVPSVGYICCCCS